MGISKALVCDSGRTLCYVAGTGESGADRGKVMVAPPNTSLDDQPPDMTPTMKAYWVWWEKIMNDWPWTVAALAKIDQRRFLKEIRSLFDRRDWTQDQREPSFTAFVTLLQIINIISEFDMDRVPAMALHPQGWIMASWTKGDDHILVIACDSGVEWKIRRWMPSNGEFPQMLSGSGLAPVKVFETAIAAYWTDGRQHNEDAAWGAGTISTK